MHMALQTEFCGLTCLNSGVLSGIISLMCYKGGVKMGEKWDILGI